MLDGAATVETANMIDDIFANAENEDLLKLSRNRFIVKTERLSDNYIYKPKTGEQSIIECNINNEVTD